MERKQSNILSHDLDLPSREAAFASLARLLDKSDLDDLWKKACLDSKVPEDTVNLDQLESVFRFISQQPGALGVFGKSLIVRVISYRSIKG